ncbi:Hydra magnipapillata [Nesidiocoris tenuis]|uniref:Hydra magnipapillata n=1 Tax=Nesidiocoris tenuis TaxID=355587 RepID=A0ABN7AH37_9HEMI|nr:Hydra magnipapillata [Nesidiocoris tenuis]
MDFSLTYQKTGQPIIGYADWGSCTIDRRSYSGHCFIFSGSAISWSAKKQSCVSLSTAEAEHAAITEATKEALHLRNLAVDLHMDQQKIKIFSDNQAAQCIAKNLVSSRSKHIDIKLHFIRDVIERRDIDYISTQEMTADILTKPLAKPRHFVLLQKLGLTSSSREKEC